MQRFPNIGFFSKITDLQKQGMYELIEDIIIADDPVLQAQQPLQMPVSFQHDINIVGQQQQILRKMEGLQSQQPVMAEKPNGKSLEQIYGIMMAEKVRIIIYSFEQQKQNILRELYNCRDYFSIDQIEHFKVEINQSQTRDQLKQIYDDFKQQRKKARCDEQVGILIDIASQVLTKKVFNGQQNVGGFLLPDLHGMEEDLRWFYQEPEVQTLITTTPMGATVQQLASNIFLQLLIRLFNRACDTTRFRKERELEQGQVEAREYLSQGRGDLKNKESLFPKSY